MSRVLGIDPGTKRIGVAVSDADRRVATPIEVVGRSGDLARDHRVLGELAAEWEVGLVVVGLPLSLTGDLGPAARQVLDELEQLRATLPVPVETYDERLTTVTAERRLTEQRMGAKARRKVVDKVAAAVMLQAWLDAQRSSQAGDR
jgi:putative Holliday junction resolvase